MSKNYQVIARKYRPQTFKEVLGQDAIVLTLKNAIRRGLIAHAYLFSGSRGVGKTTIARLFAKALNCKRRTSEGECCNQCASCLEIASGQSLDVIEIDGASNRGIDDIRQINETVGYAPSSGEYKIYIIDEVHMLTKEAFNALLKTLEEPPEKAKFFFATTEPHKVLPTIISRCQRFDLGRISSSQITAKLGEIARDMERSIDSEALHQIAAFSDGSLRDAESLFDQILCFAEGPITLDIVRTSLGLVPQELFFCLDQAFSEARVSYAFELVDQLFQAGKDLSHFLEQLIEHIRQLSICKILGESALVSGISKQYAQSAQYYTQSQCLYLLDYLIQAEAQMQKSLSPRIALETILLHLIRSKHRVPTEVLIRRLSELEEALLKSPLREELPAPSKAPPPIEQAMKSVAKAAASTNPSSPIPTKKEASALQLKPVPFQLREESMKGQPMDLSQAPQSSAPQTLQSDMSQAPLPRQEKQKQEPEQHIKPPEDTLSARKPQQHETLMRFAAVELEGSFKPN